MARRYGREHRHRPRQEISRCLKYLIFFVNFTFWICGIVCTILGVYLYAKDFRAIMEAIDFFFNPSILVIMCGFVMFFIAFLGCTGALRENICMLKSFSLFLFFSYVLLVILAFVVFILFYTDSKTGISIQTLLQTGVAKYHDNENMRELMDYLQSNLGCCGAGSQGYKDWNNNQLYNCSAGNAAPEQCGVPPSCCKVSNINATIVGAPPTAPTSTGAANVQAQVGASTSEAASNPRCGFHTQDKSITDLQNILYTDGCLQPLQRLFESNAIIIGAVIGAIIVPVCVSVTLSNLLAKQVERQRYLLAKEARKEEKRRRREKSKQREATLTTNNHTTMTLGADAQLRVARHVLESTGGGYRQPSPLTKEPPPVFFVENEHTTMHNPLFPYHDFPKTGPPQHLLPPPPPHSFGPPPPEFIHHQQRPSLTNGDMHHHQHHGPAPLPTSTSAGAGAPIYERVPKRKRRTRKTSKSRERRASGTAPHHRRSRHQSRPPGDPERYSRLGRSLSEDANLATYSGPIIVELSSVTHDSPSNINNHRRASNQASSGESLGERDSVYARRSN